MKSAAITAAMLLVLACSPAAGPLPTSPSPATTMTPSPATTTTPSATSAPTTSATTSAAATPLPTPIPLPSSAEISAPSAGVVWALVAGTRLFISSDRGDTWQERSLPRPPAPNLDVSFVSGREGWAMSAGSPATQCQAQTVLLWHTTDGAMTWTPLETSGIPSAQCKAAFSFTSPTKGFISASDPNHAPKILQTSDGGRSWSGLTLADPPGFNSQPGGFTLHAGRVHASGTALFVEAAGNAGGTERGYVFVQRSDAPGWTYLATLPNAPDAAFAFAGPDWLLIGPPGTSQESSDDGRTWHPFTTDYGQAAPIAPAVTFADASVGYATVRGVIKRTTDGGAHWTRIHTPGTAP